MELNRNQYIVKTLAVICFLAIMIASLIAWKNPATGYELDIYSGTPVLTWILIGLAIIGGTSIIIYQVANRVYQINLIWLLGLLILILSLFCFLYVPYIRNYITWGGDNISHWGMIKDVLNTGHFYLGNYYPITHSILSQLILITNTPIQLVANLSTAFLSVFFIVSTFLLAGVVLPGKGPQIIAATISAIVMVEGGYHVFLMPNGWSIFLLPLLLYFHFKGQSNHLFTFMFIILLGMYPFFHPLSGLMVAVILIAISLLGVFIIHFVKKSNNPDIYARSSLLAGVIELVILIPWILSFGDFDLNIRLMWERISSGGGEVLGKIGDSLSKMNIHGLDLGILYLKLYGADTILIILALIGLILIYYQIKKANHVSFPYFILDIGLIFLIFGLIYLLYLTGTLGLSNIGAERMIAYTMIFTPILAAISICWISQKLKNKFLNYTIVLVLIIIPAGLSLRGLYFSPYVLQPNIQITQKDMVGMEWMITKKNLKINCLNISDPPSRFADAILRSSVTAERYDLLGTQFSDHFGYEEYLTLGEQYSTDKYSGITQEGELLYSTVWKTVNRFAVTDFEKLEVDTTVSKLYSNSEMDVYYIVSMVQ